MKQDYTMPKTMTQQDWHALFGYVFASIQEVRLKSEPRNRKPTRDVSFFYPDGIRYLYDDGQFDVARYYARDLEQLCLSTGLQPTEFRDVFNSACIGRLDKSDDAELRLYDFKGSHLSESAFEKVLQSSGQPDWKHFVDHYGTIQVEDGNFGAWLENVPTHDLDAPFRYPATRTIAPLYRDEASIEVKPDPHSSQQSIFTVSFGARDADIGPLKPIRFTAPTETKEAERQMMNRLSLALDQSLMLGVVHAHKSVKAIAQEFAKPSPEVIPQPTIKKPATSEKGLVSVKVVTEETKQPLKIDKARSRRDDAHQKRLDAMPERDPELMAAALRYWKENFQDDRKHHAEYEKLGYHAVLFIRNACNSRIPSVQLTELALAHYAAQGPADKSPEELRAAFMETYANAAGHQL